MSVNYFNDPNLAVTDPKVLPLHSGYVKKLQPLGELLPTINYTLNTNGYWIYCNFPETIPASGAFYEDKSYVNRVDVPAGTHQIFFSYSSADPNICISALIVKKNSGDAISFTKKRQGIRTSQGHGGDWSYVNAGSWVPYFSSKPEQPITLKTQGEYNWVFKDVKKESDLFSGNVEFSVTGGALVYILLHKTPFDKMSAAQLPQFKIVNGAPELTGFTLCENKNYDNLPKSLTTPSYPNSGMYSGWGKGYKYAATIELDANALGNNRYFQLNTPDKATNIKINGSIPNPASDLITLNVAKAGNSSRLVSAGTTGQNLGNWATMYEFTLKLYNTNKEKAKPVNVYFQTETVGTGEYPVIYPALSDVTQFIAAYPVRYLYGQDIKKAGFEEENHAAWNFVTSTIDQGTPLTSPFNCKFTYVLGANSSHQKQFVFSAR